MSDFQKKIFEEFLGQLWGPKWLKKNPNSGKKNMWEGGLVPIKSTQFFFCHLKKIYKIYRTFWHQVYIYRLKNKISGLDSHISIRGGVPPSRADLRFFKDINLKFLYNFLDVKTFPKKRKKKEIKKNNGVRAFWVDLTFEK